MSPLYLLRSSRQSISRICSRLNQRNVLDHRRLFSISPSHSSSASQSPPLSLSSFKKPFFKVFLGAVLTYQILYYGWLRLEVEETQAEKLKILSDLQKKVKELTPNES
ncbi:hypothetical protein H112_06451 [Trichophyton rubrum D6]|uniref:Inner membrane assembly complex subunit 17 n=2 Tax=Trichophyton TaxID=5550 RepID=A0A022VV17_TRIRU|nr:hypothetical protein H100_06466 [Trichophyton rubrum MR850]EZF39425.1 hypothetical protein H102_06432 [Trichophyton rubrum CBS 100081]EZF50077.1 hypothetical protein H103_06459 [Trichophyton rubrum CBS 288.86]EZF60655.1 hypothetical protein H104_06443 [Trichophyton rubrum CBS 289.86]EZF71518.1 hypothetical protein H105_06470 [Trichophyton soudanense CBS 452.61]EZF82003.1 hypothetical protein H110_06454 [Trichophyton rubrum MR1448]EZF92670.1 hypothetical protein H113_06504 [Trichophyton rub